MHVELPRKELHALAKAAATVAKPSDLRPVLRNILLEATASGFEMTATDLTVSLWLKISLDNGAIVRKPGKALVQAQSFQRILDTVRSDTVTLKEDGTQLRVIAGKADFKMVTEDALDFPGINRFSDRKPFFTVPAKNVSGMISRVSFCAHTERSHYNMHGVLVKTDGSVVELAATNGQRLGVASTSVSSRSDDEKDDFKEIVVPAASVASLLKVAGAGKDESVDLQWMSRGMNIRGSRGEAFLLGLSGKFPPYQRGIPANSKLVELNRKKLIEILKQATALRTSTTSFVDLTLEDDKLVFEATVQDSGATKVECGGSWEHDAISLVMNPDFLLQSATSMAGEKVALEIEDVNVATLLREGSGDVDSFCVFAVARK